MPPQTKQKPSRRVYKRAGPITQPEKDLVAKLVMDQPAPVTPKQVTALASTLRRSKGAVRALVEEARETFVASAGHYVEVHKQAMDAALANGDSKSLDVAAKSAQWALTNISAEGARIVDRPSTEDKGSKIAIGIVMGGIERPITTIALPEAPAHE